MLFLCLDLNLTFDLFLLWSFCLVCAVLCCWGVLECIFVCRRSNNTSSWWCHKWNACYSWNFLSNFETNTAVSCVNWSKEQLFVVLSKRPDAEWLLPDRCSASRTTTLSSLSLVALCLRCVLQRWLPWQREASCFWLLKGFLAGPPWQYWYWPWALWCTTSVCCQRRCCITPAPGERTCRRVCGWQPGSETFKKSD